MKAPMEIGSDLHAYFRAVADDRPAPGALEAVLARTTVMRPRRAPLAWLDGVSDRLIRSADLRRVGLVVAVGLLIALALLALLTSGSRRTPHAGFLAFSHDGTVYAVGPDGGTPVAILPAGGGRGFMVPAAAWSADSELLAVNEYRDGGAETTN